MRGGVEVTESMISEPDFRIIHVFPYTAHMAGGHSNAIIAFMEGQARQGIEVRGICPLAQGVPGELQRRVEHVPIRELDFDAPDFWAKAMESTMGCQRPIFHFHGYIRQFAGLSLHLARQGIHYVATSHGQLHYREKFHWLKKFIFINFAEAFFHNASGLHFLTEREMARSIYVLPFWRRPVLVQPNLVETPDPAAVHPLPRAQYAIPARAFVFAYLGRLHVKHKGLDLLVEAFARVAADSDAYLVLVGGDWEGGRLRLENLTRQLNCDGRVRFLGAQYGESKWKALKMADAFISASRWEAFGIAQAEAMGLGLPTIVSDRMNLAPELARHKAALVSPLSSLTLADSMRALMQDEPLRQSLGTAGREWIRENCSTATAGSRFEVFYRQVLGDIEMSAPGSGALHNSPNRAGPALNVVHVFPYSPRIPGGHSNAIRTFIECQRANGLNAVGVAVRMSESPAGPDFGFPLFEVDSFAGLNWEKISRQFTMAAGNSLVHFHNVTRAYAPLISDLQRTGIPYVFTGHGQFSFKNALHGFKKCIYLNCWDRGPRKANGLHFLAKHTERRAEFLLPGYQGARLVLGNLVTIPDLAGLAIASRDEYKIPDNSFVVLFLGRLDVWIKGLDLLVEAISCLPSERFRLVLAGPDWKGGKARLEKLAEEYGCRDRVSFPGPVYGEKKWSLFKMADAFVSPSRFEAFNITQAEAMACGLPVVTSITTSLAPELRDAGAAILSPPAAEPLARAIATLEADPTLRRTMSSRGQAWVELNCNPKRAGERFRSFYESIMEQRAAKI
jgi:glycosyltransferase involved in cell wall biosynthesis